MFEPRDLRLEDRRASGRHKNLAGGHGAAVVQEADRIGIDDLGAALDDLYAGPLEVGGIDFRQAGNFLLLRRGELAPLEGGRHRHGPAEPARVGEIIDEAAGIDIELLGHAAANDAGAADAELFGDHHLGAVASGNARCAHAARPGTDDEEIDVVGAHQLNPPRRNGSDVVTLLLHLRAHTLKHTH